LRKSGQFEASRVMEADAMKLIVLCGAVSLVLLYALHHWVTNIQF
jgi:hypothetical protein